MAVKGQKAKEELMQEIIDMLGDKRAFKYEKDLRVNCMENGELVQIKLAFTAAKVPVERDGDIALPGSTIVVDTKDAPAMTFGTNMETAEVAKPTAEEKQNIADLLAKLGL